MTARHDAHAPGGGGTRSLTADAIAALVGGKLVGDGKVEVRGVAPLDRAVANEISFLGMAKYAPMLAATRAGVILVSPALAEVAGGPSSRILVDRPHEAMLALIPELYEVPVTPPGIHPTAVLGRGVRIGSDVFIGPYAVIGDDVVLGDRVLVGSHCVLGSGVTVGEDTHLLSSVTLYAGAVVGARARLHSGVRVATDGFGYVFKDGAHQKLQHVGRCVIGDDVEIGANSTIDRGSIDDTVVGAGTKIDNLVHVGHNVRIGRMCLIMAQVGIAGSARIEDGCILAGQAGIGGHVTIGKGARIGGQSGVFGDVPAGEAWSGYPARPHKDSLRAHAAMFKLPNLIRRLERLLDQKEP
ncbi:MAG: UDP-3-O-(3-hydroxymyristoyl)glucosamine N-acyltransferase [Gemmatimonadota bacterium]|nr:UDP-3-O-(3-hydroxymyristoyl)glucosamine N-acyltransferase [Gemmatimonadota bacterium]